MPKPPEPVERIDLGDLAQRVNLPQGGEIGIDQRERQEGLSRLARQRRHMRPRRFQRHPRRLAELRQHVGQPLARLSGQDLLRRRTVAEQRFGRQIDASQRCVDRKRPHQAGEAVGDAGGPHRGLDLGGPVRRRHLRRQTEERAGGLAEIIVERRGVGHDLHRHIEAPRVDQACEAIARQRVAPDGAADGVGDRVPSGFAGSGAIERIAPPLQANFAELRLAHLLGGAGKLDIEGVKGKERLARRPRREQRARIAVRIPIARDGPDRILSFAFLQGLPLKALARLVQARALAPAFVLAGAAVMPPSRLTPRISCSGAAT